MNIQYDSLYESGQSCIASSSFECFLTMILVAVLLQKCINLLALTTVTDALDFLEKLQAVVVSSDKGRHAYHPSKYRELLVSIPLSLESAIFVMRGGIAGYMRESVILGAIMGTTPFPILQPFGQPVQVSLCNSTSGIKSKHDFLN